MNEEQRDALANEEPSEEAKAMQTNDEKANPEVFEQPSEGETVSLPTDTVIAKEPLDKPQTR